jgi:hypothetical protein
MAGRSRDAKTVPEVLNDLEQRFGLKRVVFVGDRGMVRSHNLALAREQGHGYSDAFAVAVSGLNMIAARLRPDAISETSSSHLPPSEASKLGKPVMFPPGRPSRVTRPLATGSATSAKTIGIVRVSR